MATPAEWQWQWQWRIVVIAAMIHARGADAGKGRGLAVTTAGSATPILTLMRTSQRRYPIPALASSLATTNRRL